MDRLKIYFDPIKHKYTDERNNPYTSTTTLIGQYCDKFDTKYMARQCALSGMRGNAKYAGKTAKQLEIEWTKITEDACEKGSTKHNYLEECIKEHNGYNKIDSKFQNGLMYTVFDVIDDEELGRIHIPDLEAHGIKDRFPKIFKTLVMLIESGYRLHSEVSVYNPYYLISGMIDLFAIKDYDFLVVDWKTNKAPIRYESGYFKKDNNGNLTDEYVYTGKYFHRPIHNLQDSTGNHYKMQLSIYDFLAEQFGLNCKGNILFHIRERVNDSQQMEEFVESITMEYLKKDVLNLLEFNRSKMTVNTQMKLL